jgi:hypothetical protein
MACRRIVKLRRGLLLWPLVGPTRATARRASVGSTEATTDGSTGFGVVGPKQNGPTRRHHSPAIAGPSCPSRLQPVATVPGRGENWLRPRTGCGTIGRGVVRAGLPTRISGPTGVRNRSEISPCWHPICKSLSDYSSGPRPAGYGPTRGWAGKPGPDAVAQGGCPASSLFRHRRPVPSSWGGPPVFLPPHRRDGPILVTGHETSPAAHRLQVPSSRNPSGETIQTAPDRAAGRAMPMECIRCGEPLVSILERSRKLCASCFLHPGPQAERRPQETPAERRSDAPMGPAGEAEERGER